MPTGKGTASENKEKVVEDRVVDVPEKNQDQDSTPDAIIPETQEKPIVFESLEVCLPCLREGEIFEPVQACLPEEKVDHPTYTPAVSSLTIEGASALSALPLCVQDEGQFTFFHKINQITGFSPFIFSDIDTLQVVSGQPFSFAEPILFVPPPSPPPPPPPSPPAPSFITVMGLEENQVEEDDLNNLQSIGINEDSSINQFIATGSISDLVSTGVGDRVSFNLISDVSSLTAAGIASQGVLLDYAVLGDTLTAIAGGRTVFTLQILSDGHYTFTLFDQLDHSAGGGENNLVLHLGSVVNAVNLEGESALLTGLFSITVQDDIPVAEDQVVVQALDPVSTNLLITLDVSGSMNTLVPGLSNVTRLDAAKASINELFEQYNSLGEVRVQLVTFSTSATLTSPDWMTIDEAKVILNALIAGGTTNYHAAITTAETAFATSGKIVDAVNVSYFLSDGMPTTGTLTALEQADWENLLSANDMNSFALGIGPESSAPALVPIGFNGSEEMPIAPLIVTDISQLSATLTDTITFGSITGTLVGNALAEAHIGADEPGNIFSITLPGDKTYAFDAELNTITPSGSGISTFTFMPAIHELIVTSPTFGSLAIRMDTGEYVYTIPVALISGAHQIVLFTVMDFDGDIVSASIDFSVTHEFTPLVRDDRVITNIPGVDAAIPIPDAALLNNDSSPLGLTLSLASVFGAASGSIAHLGVITTFTDSGSNGGSFFYTGSDNLSLSDTGFVTVERVSGDTLNADGLGNILIGNNLNDFLNGAQGPDFLVGNDGQDSLTGNAGNDVLMAGPGADLLNGGSGDDILNGGPGNDTLDGGTGLNLIDFSDASGGITFTLTQSGSDTMVDLVSVGLGMDTYKNISGVIGTPFADTLIGSTSNDLLQGNGGADSLTGNDGHDTFQFTTADALAPDHTVTVTDFTIGLSANADTLDLSQLLDSNVTDESGANVIANSLHFSFSGGNTDIEVNADAAGSPEMHIQLTGINLTLLGNDTQIIQQLLDDQNLHIG